MNFADLKTPFPAEDIEWRVQSCGEKNGKIWALVLAYVTARAIQDRLDDVCGPENWQNEFRPGVDGGVLCGLSVRIGDEWVTKWDGAENTQVEAVKGGMSGATKRAAVQWGIGRYLYKLTEGWANVHPGGKHRGKTKENKWFKWDAPELPSWALPGDAPPKQDEPASPVAVVEKEAAKQFIPLADLREYALDKHKCNYEDMTPDSLRDVYREIRDGAVTKWLNERVPT